MTDMPRYRLFQRDDCHLCDEALAVLAAARLPAFESVFIDDDDALEGRYGLRVPVLRDEVRAVELDWPFDARQVHDWTLGAVEADDSADEANIVCWQANIMRHLLPDGSSEYAVHEVYLDGIGRVVAWTLDALSPRMPAVSDLQAWIVLQLQLCDQSEGVTCGDLGYRYYQEDFLLWLEGLQRPVLAFKPR